MSDDSDDMRTQDERLLAQLADEMVRRCRSGESVDIERYAALYPELAERVREVLPAIVAMEQPAEPDPGEPIGSTIGRYTLLERLGEGGFGVVYKAQQQEPMRRLVALKVIKPGVDTRQVIARFEAERQALAMMDHENIARVFDAGTSESGRPYFVMELVNGVPITAYCDARQLATRERLALFVQVCRAVQHAHTKGIIHRDIKPTNVLVAVQDGKPVPKVIDFGVAKATGGAGQLTERSLFTQAAHLVGTPLYMSPEQAQMTGVDVDTRSDIYSLGVLLYELLTGTTPLDRERLKQAAFDEVRRIIREEDPPRPSTRLSAMGASLHTVSAQRGTDARQLGRQIRGELDWIVMKSLEKDRNRRYETAQGLESDVERYMRDEPVLAGPPGASYRLRKFVRRHRGPVLAAAFVVVALVAGITGTTWGLIDADRARREETRQRQVAEEQGTRAVDEEKKARAELNRAEWLLYASRLNQAQQAWAGNDPILARHFLGLARPDFRGWEYDYLARQFAERQRAFRGHDLDVMCLALSADGRRIFSGAADGTIKAWDVLTGEATLSFKGHPGGIYSIAVSADGRRIVSGSTDSSVKIWDAATGREVRTFNDHANYVHHVAFDQSNRILASSSSDGNLKLWDLETGDVFRTLPHGDAVVLRTAFTSDGRRLFSCTYNALRMWNVETGEVLRTLTVPQSTFAFCMALSSDGRRIAIGFTDGSIKLLAAETFGEQATLRGHTNHITGLAFSPDGKVLLSGSFDGSAKLWETATGRELRTLRGHASAVQSVAMSPDGIHAWTGGADRVVYQWDLSEAENSLPSSVFSGANLVLSRDGEEIVSGGFEPAVIVSHSRTGREIRRFTGLREVVQCLAMSADERRIAAGCNDGAVVVWDKQTGRPLRTFAGEGITMHSVALNADGSRIAYDRNRGWGVVVADVATGQEVFFLRHPSPVADVIITADGRRIVSSDITGNVIVWNMDTGSEIRRLAGHADMVSALAPMPDGRRLVTASRDQTIRVWDLRTGEALLTLRGHTGSVEDVAVMPDGRRIVSGSTDKTVKVWDADSGHEVLTIGGMPNFVAAIAVSPDGRRVLATSNAQVKVWDAGSLPAIP